MAAVDQLVFALYRACSNTKYAIDALQLQSIGRHKAEQLIGSLQYLCRYWTMTQGQGDKAMEVVTSYNDRLMQLLPNLHPNKERVAAIIAETLDQVDELCAAIVATPEPVSPTVVAEANPRRVGRPPRVLTGAPTQQ